MRLSTLRKQIDALDRRLVALLNERASVAALVGKLKRPVDDVYVPAREQDVLANVRRANRGPLDARALSAIFREVISFSRALERPLRIAYFGPATTFTHQAAVQRFGGGVTYLPCDSIGDVFDGVQKGAMEYGVVPIENSTEGAVAQTLDECVRTPLAICAELYLPVSHHLLVRSGPRSATVARAAIRRIASHPQVFGQCRAWLRAELPGVPLVPESSTARAAELASRDPSLAAIAGSLAAEQYGLRVLARDIQDQSGNLTRFLVLGRSYGEPTGADKTSLVFSVKHRAGALYAALGVFKRRGLNLTRIESRPTKRTPWEYLFFVDFEGHARAPRVARALAELERHCTRMTVLGSYPRADWPEGRP